MKPLFAFIFFSTLIEFSHAQDIIKVDMIEKGVLEEAFALPLFALHNGKFFYESDTFSLTIPDEYLNEHSALGLIFYKGLKSNKIPNHVPILVTQLEGKPFVLLDTDNDLNFRDEQPQQLSDTLYLETQHDASRKFMALLKQFKPANDEVKRSIKNSFASNQSFKGNEFLEVDHWLQVQSINYRSNMLIIDKDSIQIGLIDGTSNGIFNDLQWDRAFTAPYDVEQKSDQVLKTQIINKKTAVEIGNEFYLITDVDSLGDYLVLSKYVDGVHILEAGEKVPSFVLTNFDGNDVNISSHFGDTAYSLLYFWGSWCKPCIEKIPTLKVLHADFKNLKIFGINSFDQIIKAKKVVETNNIPWENFTASKEIIESFGVNKFPTYILVDQKGSIVSTDFQLEKVKIIVTE